MKYELKVLETENKNGRFLYQVFDEAGFIVSQRRSNRKYIACTSDGQYYFGRLDLIGKGEHGQQIKWCIEHNRQQKAMAYIKEV